jgi:hypothetical protein
VEASLTAKIALNRSLGTADDQGGGDNNALRCVFVQSQSSQLVLNMLF